MLWRLLFRLTPGFLIRSDRRWLNAPYLAVAARAYAAEEVASGRIPDEKEPGAEVIRAGF